jgi:hypothetical protein
MDFVWYQLESLKYWNNLFSGPDRVNSVAQC